MISKIDGLIEALKRRRSRIKEIYLQVNNIEDETATLLYDAIDAKPNIIVLNLSKNKLTDISCSALGVMVNGNDALKELYLGQNTITQQGAIQILDGLLKRPILTVLDLSWNRLSIKPLVEIKENEGFFDYLGKLFLEHDKLIHFDISFNKFSRKEAEVIAEFLKQNHTLMGFHFNLNAGVLDDQQFIIFPHYLEKEHY